MDKKLADYLWTARWATKASKPDIAYENLTEALYHIGAEKKPGKKEPDRPNIPPPVVIPQEPTVNDKGLRPIGSDPIFVEFDHVSFPKRGNYKTPSGMFIGRVNHYSVSPRTAAKGVMEWGASQGYAFMTMHEDGRIFIPKGFDVLRHWGYHAGTSKWRGMTSVSNKFAGIEVACWGRNPPKNRTKGPFRTSKGEANIIAGEYECFSPQQERELLNFDLWALRKNPDYEIANIVGHDELRAEAGRKGDKQDPGASLSMTGPQYRALVEREAKRLGIR